MEQKNKEKEPVILDFSGDVIEALNKLDSILYTSGWSNHLVIHPDIPNEDKMLISLIREKAIVVGEYYYTFTYEISEELKSRAYDYFHRLRKRDMDSIYLNSVNYFSRYTPDIDKTDNGALFYPEINAYIRCGSLSPVKMFELMQADGCKRIIIFGNGLLLNKEEPWEVFHSFEMNAPKEYIMESLKNLQDEKSQAYIDAMERSGADKLIPDVKYPTTE